MTSLKTLTLLALTALLATGCHPGGEQTADDTKANPLLAYVPADTPFVFANLETAPPAVMDAWLKRLEPLAKVGEQSLADVRSELANVQDPEQQAGIDLFLAISDEIAGKLNRDGLESMGLSLESNSAIYGNGLFPVVRLGLKDAAALRATIERIQAKSGVTAEERQFNGASYWRLGEDPVAVYVAILADHVAIGVTPPSLEADFLPAFLGQALPEHSLGAAGTLSALNKAEGYSGFGSGFIDLNRVADELLNPASYTATRLNTAFGYDASQTSPVCAAEYRAIVAHAPRASAGVTELTGNSLGMRYRVKIEENLADQLARLVADIPKASAAGDAVFSLSLGIEVGRLREFLLDKFTTAAATPFQCPRLARLNQGIQAAADRLNQPMPPFIGNFRGVRVELNDFDFKNFDPAKSTGLLAIEVENPEILTGMASMFVPGMEDLDLHPGGEPVQVPQELLSMVTPDFQVRAMMTSDALGVSLGKDESGKLLPFMQLKGSDDGTFLSMEYDLAALAEAQNSFEGLAGVGGPEAEAWRTHHEALVKAYQSMLGRTRMEFRFTDEGLVVDSHTAFP